jgi:hypothetical protein
MHGGRSALALAVLALSLAVLPGCATRVTVNATMNPPPTQAFSAFSRIELKPVRAAADSGASPEGVTRIQSNLQQQLAAWLAAWNRGPDDGRKLVIEPMVKQMEYQRVAKRIWLGPLAGESGVLLELCITDGEGRLVASPQFFQRADAWGASFTFVHDNLMLPRVARLASDYVIANHAQAKGGPTGADDKAAARQ